MKGYSFQELVKLAEAAVKRAGDAMTGNLTAPKVLVSGAQGTEANTLTRKDYVDAELTKKLNLVGGTLTGNLTAPAVLVSSAQNTSANALTRKDYVDSAIANGDALQVSKTGDTMTGNLTVPKVLVSGAQGTESNALTRKDYVDSAIAAGDALRVSKTGDTMTGDLTASKVLVSGAQGTEVNALTRRDYVDAELSKKLSLTGGTMTGELHVNGELRSRSLSINDTSSGARLVIIPQGSNERFTIDMYPASSGAYQVMEFRGSDRTTSFKQIVSCDAAPVAAKHLTRKDYVDSAIAAGDALQVSKSGDTMTGNLTAPKVLVSGAQGTESNALARKDYVDTESAKKVNKAGDTMTGNLFAPAVLVSSAQDASPNALTRKDYVDSQIGTRAPEEHNHPAYRGNSDVVAGGWDHVGAYVMAQVYPADGIGEIPPGGRLSGAFLRPCSMDNDPDDMYGATLPGAWQCQGYARGRNAGEGDWTGHKTLWIRVA